MKSGCLAIVFTAACFLGTECIHGSAQGESQKSEHNLVAFMDKFLGPPSAGATPGKRFLAAHVDLRDDGKREVVVYITDPDYCGSGGCTTLILEPENSSYRIVTKMTIVQLPICVLQSKSNGWHNLSVWVQGGGIQPGYEAKLTFDGKTYPSNPTFAPAQPPVQEAKGKVVISSAMLERAIKTKPIPIHVETIVPGRAVGNLTLGSSESQLGQAVFDWQPKAGISSHEDACHQRNISWVNTEGNYPVISAFLSDEGVIEIIVTLQLEVQGIGNVHGRKLADVKDAMPNGTLYRWKGSDWKMPGGADEFFWVVESKGIAFGLDYNQKQKTRTVDSVTIFKPRGKFQPEGCLINSQELLPAMESGSR